uniref:Uncharacterized protein n=1 Tax=Physcomitrium patens TaxID=3218 RepID=A0A7I3YY78_PHYPA
MRFSTTLVCQEARIPCPTHVAFDVQLQLLDGACALFWGLWIPARCPMVRSSALEAKNGKVAQKLGGGCVSSWQGVLNRSQT